MAKPNPKANALRHARNKRARERRKARERESGDRAGRAWVPRVDRVAEESVEIKAGKTTRKAGLRLCKWHIYCEGTHVGRVSIMEEPPEAGMEVGAIDISIAKPHRGRGIGSLAYRLACLESGMDIIYARMRKNNIGSARAALKAGFTLSAETETTQSVLVWIRGDGPSPRKQSFMSM